jgi:hypothetical protein
LQTRVLCADAPGWEVYGRYACAYFGAEM